MTIRLALLFCFQTISIYSFSQRVEIANQGPKIDTEFPHINAITMAGDTINTKDLADKILVINIWFVGCKGCRQEEPYLRQLVSEFKDIEKFRFISFCMSREERISKYFRKNGGFGYETISTTRNYVQNKFNVITSPSHFIVKNGILIAKYTGPITSNGGSLQWFKNELNKLL